MDTTPGPLRPISSDDFPAVLAWNQSHVELLAPLDAARLDQLLGWTDNGSVITQGGDDVGFVLTFAARSSYDSANYRWFAERHADFLYLDRIVIDPSVRRSGVASRVYGALEARAGRLGPVLCLEVNLVPPTSPRWPSTAAAASSRSDSSRRVGTWSACWRSGCRDPGAGSHPRLRALIAAMLG